MSVTAYVGLPGSGKSYSVVELQILPALRAGRKVVTNIPLVMPEIDKLNLAGEVVHFEVAELVAEPHKILEYCVPGCIFVIDETWRLFPAGVQPVDIPEQFRSLLTEHRHMVDARGNSTQIVLCTQDLGMIAKFARGVVENTFVTTKLSFVGLARAYRVDVFFGPVTGCTPNPKKALRQIPGRYRKEIYCLYKSHTMSESAVAGANEQKMDGRANILLRPVFLIGCVLVPLMFWFSIHTLGKVFHGTEKPSAPAVGPARSGAERVVDSLRPRAAGIVGPPEIRVLLEVARSGYELVYLSVGSRLVELGGDQCRRLGKHLQCWYQGAYYDGFGQVELASRGPGTGDRGFLVQK